MRRGVSGRDAAAAGFGRGLRFGRRLGRGLVLVRLGVDLGHGRLRQASGACAGSSCFAFLTTRMERWTVGSFLGKYLLRIFSASSFEMVLEGTRHVNALAAHLFDEALRLHLQLFGEVVNPDL